MSVIDMVRSWNEKKKEKSDAFKRMQEQDRLETMLEERKKSANRRELERHMNEKEEEQIKQALDKIRKKRNKETWKSNSLLKGGKSIMNTDRPILKEKNIFKANKKLKKEKSMFKW